MWPEKKGARERQLAKPQRNAFDAERFTPELDRNQPITDQTVEEFIEKLGIMADWLESLTLRIKRRQTSKS